MVLQQCSFTKIHFIRHAETTLNRDDKVSGNGTDPALTENGIVQADLRGQELLKYKDNIAFAVSSNMTRTNQTAQIINQWLNLELKLDSNLQEKYFGDLEGKDRSLMKKLYDEGDQNGITDIVALYGGESKIQFAERAKSTICDYFNSNEKEILLVSHGHFGRIATSIFYNVTRFFDNADHVIFDPYEIDNVHEICGFNECIIDTLS